MMTPEAAAAVAAPIAIAVVAEDRMVLRVASPEFARLLRPVDSADAAVRDPVGPVASVEGQPLDGAALRFDPASYASALTRLSEGAREVDLITWRRHGAGDEPVSAGLPYRLIMRPYPLRTDDSPGDGDDRSAVRAVFITAELYGMRTDGNDREQRLFGQLVQHSPDIIAVIDRAFRHVYVNEAILAASGRPAEDFVGRDHAELDMPPDLVEYFQSVYADVFESGQEGHKEFEFPAPDGGIRTYVSRVVPLTEPDGETRVLLSFARDVTARRAAEAGRLELERKLQETQRLESLGLLAGGIAHDFNNILASVVGMASLARAQSEEGATDAAFAQIEKSCLKAADLCNQMLAYAGRGHTLKADLDLVALIRETQDLVHGTIPNTVTVTAELPDEPLMTHVDRAQLQQVLMNLLLNAVECYGGSRGRVAVRVDQGAYRAADWAGAAVAPAAPNPSADDTPGPLVRVEVQDFGPGMNEETLSRVFDPFFSTKFAGRGLGLAATLGIVRSHGGGLRVHTKPGEGSTFTLALPLSNAAPAHDEVTATPPRVRERTGRVLIVDDEPEVREAARLMTEALGYTTLVCADGPSALCHFGVGETTEGRATDVADAGEAGADTDTDIDTDIDIVLLDLTMPEMNGVEVLEQIRARRPELPIVLMSGYTESDIRERFADSNAVIFLKKPFRLDELDSALSGVARTTKRPHTGWLNEPAQGQRQEDTGAGRPRRPSEPARGPSGV